MGTSLRTKPTTTSLLAIVVFAGSSACSPSMPLVPAEQPMRAFSSDAEFETYMKKLMQASSSRTGGEVDAQAAPAPASEAASANEEITNNQEQGVDEGGIVKNIGEHLVMLRKGRLYAISVAQAGNLAQTGSIRVAPDEALNSGVWYDEMLVSGRDIYVIGYRYLTRVRDQNDPETYLHWIHGATEVSHFVLDGSGGFERGDSMFFESADYYSGRNYASRMVDGKLLFYMPYYAFIYNHETQAQSLRVPRFLKYNGNGEFSGGLPMFRGTDVFKPHRDPDYATFHTLVACDLDRGFSCKARSLVGDWSREFYVTRERVYLWNHPRVVAFSLRTLTPTSHAVVGYPSDQFSFRESEGVLHVGVRVGASEWPLSIAESKAMEASRLALLSLDLSEFDAQGQQVIGEDHLTQLALIGSESSMWVPRNRFAEGWYLAALESYEVTGRRSRLIAHHLETAALITLDFDGLATSRIEPMARFGALIAATNHRSIGGDLKLLPLRLSRNGVAELEPGVVVPGMREGESRSHGFFYRPTATGGVFGLPIIGNAGARHWWGQGISNIAFVDVDASVDVGACEARSDACEDGPLSLLGTLSSSDESGGSCETSCIDWYGNTRPIFLGERLFALMGSEVVEGTITESGVTPLGQPLIMTRD